MDAMALLLLLAGTGALEQTEEPSNAAISLGNGCCFLSDLNADGCAEYAFVARSRESSWIQVHSGRDGRVLRRIACEGGSVFDAGDLDGDGHGDLALLGEHRAVDGERRGRIEWFSAVSGALLRSTLLESEAQFLAFDDQNGDGVADPVVTSEPVPGKRRVAVVCARTDVPLAVCDLEEPDSKTIPSYGGRLRWLGDLDGDGRGELGRIRGSQVEVFATDGTLRSAWPLPAAFASWMVPPTRASIWTFAAVGDLDQDGVRDLAVTAMRNRVGHLLVFSSAKGELIGQTTDPCDDFGITVTAAGDLNADGVEDIAVGVGGMFTEDLQRLSGADLTRLPDVDRRYVAWLGESLKSGADVDGDCVPDLLSGTQRAGAGGSGREIVVVSGRTGELLRAHVARDQTPPER